MRFSPTVLKPILIALMGIASMQTSMEGARCIFLEDFTGDCGIGVTGPSGCLACPIDTSTVPWNIVDCNSAMTGTGDVFRVQTQCGSEVMMGIDTEGDIYWVSAPCGGGCGIGAQGSIDITNNMAISLSIYADNEGGLEDSGGNIDWIDFEYRVDGGAWTLLENLECQAGMCDHSFRGAFCGNTYTRVINTAAICTGTNLQLRASIQSSAEDMWFDNIRVQSGTIWDAGAGCNNWSSCANWDVDAEAMRCEDVIIGTGGSVANLCASKQVNTITLNRAANFCITNSGCEVLTIASGLTANPGAARTYTLSTCVALGGANCWTTNANTTLNISGTLDTNGNTLTLNDTGCTNVTGSLTCGGSVVKNGSGTLTITNGSNSFAPTNMTISSGEVRLGSSNSIADATDITLAGGTLVLNDFDETIDNVTLTANSIIDFAGAGGSILNINNLNLGGFTLSIHNWTGTAPYSGGESDQFIVGGTITGTIGTQILIYSGTATGLLGNGGNWSKQLISNEIVPTPETSSWVSSGLVLGFIAFHIIRKRKKANEAG